MKPLPKKGLVKVHKSNKFVKKLKKYWGEYKDIESEYFHSIQKLEEEMQGDLKNELLEFFFCDNECVGIGTPTNPKKMKLIQREHLEE